MIKEINKYIDSLKNKQIVKNPRFLFDLIEKRIKYDFDESNKYLKYFDVQTYKICSLEDLKELINNNKIIIYYENYLFKYDNPNIFYFRCCIISEDIINENISEINKKINDEKIPTFEEIKDLLEKTNKLIKTNSPFFCFDGKTKKINEEYIIDKSETINNINLFDMNLSYYNINSFLDLNKIIERSDIAIVVFEDIKKSIIFSPINPKIHNGEIKLGISLRLAEISENLISKKINENINKNILSTNNNLDIKYKNLVEDILENGTISKDRTGTGTQKLFGKMIRHNMSEGFPLLTTKKIYWKAIVHELLWFLKGDTKIKYLVDNNVNIWVGDAYKRYLKYLNEFSDIETFRPELIKIDLDPSEPTENGIYHIRPFTKKEFIEKIKTNFEFSEEFGDIGKCYGSEWTNWDNRINQIQDVLDTLISNPDSRRMIVTAWNPTNIKKALVPSCHYSFQIITRELSFKEKVQWVLRNTDVEMENLAITEKCYEDSTPKRSISLLFNMRSVDVALGLPFDIASYAILLSMFAQYANMIPEEVICSLGDTHLYLNQIEPIKEQIQNSFFKLPTLNLNKNIKNIFDFKIDDIKIENYISHDKKIIPLSN